MATFIDGIGASENIDTSGERVSMSGMDISSLTVDGVFNWEHKKDEPSQVVGKVLKAKKIFSDKDCDDERQLYFWQKIQTPYLYVMGELFDDYKDSAKEVAGMFRYDADRKGQNERNVMNFSVEGGKIEKVGMDVLKSVARKITITVLPCNKAAVAEMVPNAEIKQPKDDIESIFKTEPGIEIELFKPTVAENFAEMIKAQATKPLEMNKAADSTTNPKGSVIGRTTGGADVWSHARVADYQNLSSQGHKEASKFHGVAAEKAGNDFKLRDHHMGKMKLHSQAATTAAKRETRGTAAPPIKTPPKPSTSKLFVDIPGKDRGITKSETMQKADESSHAKVGDVVHLHMPKENEKIKGVVRSIHTKEMGMGGKDLPKDEHMAHVEITEHGRQNVRHPKGDRYFVKAKYGKTSGDDLHITPHDEMKKALTAGSGMGAPSTLEGGAALAKESLEGKRRKNATKSPWFARAEQEYLNWNKREQFETFMAKRMPHLSKGEIQAIGKVVALKKAVEMEQGLASMIKMARVDEGKSPEQKVKARGDRHLRTAWDEKPANQKVGEHKWEGKPDKKAVGHKEGFVKLQETGVHHPYDLDHPKGVGQSAAGMNTADHKDFGDHEAKASAKKIHHKVLGEMKAIPKPNIPKK